MEIPLSYTTYIVALTTIFALFYYKKFKNTIYKFFVIYLIYALFTDLLGFLIGNVYKMESFPIYNTYTIITFLFYFSFYKKLFKKERNVKIMTWFLILYVLFTVFDIIILKSHFLSFTPNNLVFGAILLIITQILFLMEIINDEKIVFNIKKSFIFWISIGVLLFYIGIIPIMVSADFLQFNGIFDTILLVINAIMYGCFIAGFILSDKKYNY